MRLRRGWDCVAESLLELAIAAEQAGEPGKLRDGRRFGLIDLGRMLDRGRLVAPPGGETGRKVDGPSHRGNRQRRRLGMGI